VIAFSVALREQEMAVRMALGLQRSGVILLILSSGAKLSAVGCGLGLLGAMAASRLLRSFLFEVSPFDPGVLALSAIAMLLLALAASALPAQTRIEHGSHAGFARRIGRLRFGIVPSFCSRTIAPA